MKRTFIFTLLAIAAIANPAWYDKLSAKPYEKIGYGASTSLEEARQDAIADIGDQIADIQVSEIKFKGAVMKNAERVLSRDASAELKGAEIIKLEQKGRGYFVAAKLDRRPIEVRLLEKMKTPKRRESDDGFVFRSPFARELNKIAGYAVDFSIEKNGDLYAIGDKKNSLVWNEPDLTRLFDISQNPALKLSLDADLNATIDANASGHLALIYLNEFGEYSSKAAQIEANQTIVVSPQAIASDSAVSGRAFLIAVFSVAPFGEDFPSAQAPQVGGFDKLARFLERRVYSAVEIKRARSD